MKEESPVKTINPQLAYLNLAENKDFQYAYTSFTNVVNDFADEIDKAYEHHLTKVNVDPIAAEVEFYKTLNTDLAKGPDSDDKPESGDESKSDKLKAEVSRFANSKAGELLMTQDKVTSAVEDLLGTDIQMPEADSKNPVFDSDFLAFWIDKYQTAHYRVKQAVESELGDDNVFFVDFSESMVSLRHHYFTQDRTTLHLFDTDSVVQDIPNQCNGATNEILDYQTKLTTYELSKLTNAVFRQNIIHLGEVQKMEENGTTDDQLTFAASTAPHGINVVVDFMHPHRMAGLAGELSSILYSDLKGLHRLSYFLEQATCHQEVRKQSIGIDVEKLLVKVDFLGRKLVNTDSGVYASSSRTNDVLGVNGKTIAQYSAVPFDQQS